MEILLPLMVLAGIGLFFGLVITVIVVSHKKARARMAEFYAYAQQLGWQPFSPPVPWPVDTTARSRRTKLALTRHDDVQPQIWMVWHQWTESTGSGDSQSTTTRNRTHYYLWLGLNYPPMEVRGRTSIGAFFKPVRGIGTGDLEFDKRFVIKPSDRPEPLHVVTPAIRQAMMAGQVGSWEISQGTLVQAYETAPTIENLQPRTEIIGYLARLL